MTHIFERVSLECPYAQAREYLQQDSSAFIPAIPPFTVELEHTEDPLRFDQRLHVHWTPKGGAILPQFTGEIVLRADRDLDGMPVLELSGSYAPPFGVPGKAFDLFIGQKIASATAKSVLRKIAHDIENGPAKPEKRAC